jgi:hypothetical protein
LKSDVERSAVSLAFALCFERGQLRFTDIVVAEVENRFFVVALDRENLLENGLEALIFPLRISYVFLQKIDVGIELDFNQVWRLDPKWIRSEFRSDIITKPRVELAPALQWIATVWVQNYGNDREARSAKIASKRRLVK